MGLYNLIQGNLLPPAASVCAKHETVIQCWSSLPTAGFKELLCLIVVFAFHCAAINVFIYLVMVCRRI